MNSLTMNRARQIVGQSKGRGVIGVSALRNGESGAAAEPQRVKGHKMSIESNQEYILRQNQE